MSTEIDRGIDWQTIARALATPFDPSDVEWRPSGKAGPNQRVSLVAYVDARTVQDRLDEVVGVGGWSFDWSPVVVAGNEVQAAKGTLTILGVSKSDIGTASNWEASKGAVSDALKRAGVQFGLGRYLYALPAVWVTLDSDGKVPDETLAQIRKRLAARIAA
jgi:hypothetical protein